jgi:phage-related minor tail protein
VLFRSLSELQVRSGINKQIEGLLGDKKNNKLKEAIDIYSTTLDKETKDIESSLKLKDIARKSETESTAYLRLTDEQRGDSNKKYAESTEDARRSLATAESIKSILIAKTIKDSPLADSALTKAATSAMGVGEKQFSDAVRLFNITNDITKTTEDRATQSAIINRDYDSQGRISELVLSATTQTYDINKQALDQSQASLDLKQSSSAITQNDYDQQTRLNKLEGIRLDTAQQLSLAIAEYVKKSDTLNREVDLGVASPTRLAEINQERAATLLYFTQGREKVIAFGAAQIDQVNATYEMSTTMKGFAKIVEDSFLNMGDALVEFAKTGKLDFAGLINSMISDLARFAIRASMQSAFNSANSTGTGIDSFISTIGNFFTGTTSGPEQLGGDRYAKGAAWEAGIEKFALGGSFTNSIVNSPTLFKFAKGTGMMGEAGPEAIMPLKRDSQGNLGVRSGGGGAVAVVVNNYSASEATTKETTDSNGNRRIEVIIGDIVAKEVGRANSPINAGMKANFQLQPNLVRR